MNTETKVPAPGIRGLIKGAVLALCYIWLFPQLTVWISDAAVSFGWGQMSTGAILLIPYYASFVLAVLLFRNYLIDAFERFTGSFGRCIGSMIRAYGLMILVTLVCSALLMMIAGEGTENPNDAAVEEVFRLVDRPTTVVAVLLGPLVEEIIFRGVIFGAIEQKSSKLAYLVSWLAFGAAHLVGYAFSFKDLSVLILLIQYLPPCIAWGWCYKKSGSLWTTIFMHMLYNGMGVWAMSMLRF